MNLHSKQVVKKAPIASNAAVSSELAATMAFSSSSSALEEILGDRQLFETQGGISYDEALLDSDVTGSSMAREVCMDKSMCKIWTAGSPELTHKKKNGKLW